MRPERDHLARKQQAAPRVPVAVPRASAVVPRGGEMVPRSSSTSSLLLGGPQLNHVLALLSPWPPPGPPGISSSQALPCSPRSDPWPGAPRWPLGGHLDGLEHPLAASTQLLGGSWGWCSPEPLSPSYPVASSLSGLPGSAEKHPEYPVHRKMRLITQGALPS